MYGEIYQNVPFVAVSKRLSGALLNSVRQTTRILIVVDDGIGLEPGAIFGISRLIDLLNSPASWPIFQLLLTPEVDIARRGLGDPTENDNAQKYEPSFENFRFDMEGFNLDEYDQVWLFGWWSEEHPSELSETEIAVLSAWMNNGGGVFATGDHGTLGAALCKNVPRVRSMRRWTSNQNPPPQHGPERHITIQPATVGQGSGYETIPAQNERDSIPKPISPTAWYLRNDSDEQGRLLNIETVHPLLCGIGGPITILPDHPHEGEVVSFVNIDIIDPEELDYPRMDGIRPRPNVIARARSGPPPWVRANLQYEGGQVDAQDFAAVGAYDGQQIGIGRVVVDSSLHHWLNLNLEGLDEDELAQIQTYHLNVAAWLGRREHRLHSMIGAMLTTILIYPGLGDIRHRTEDLLEVGRATGERLRLNVPDCEIANLVMSSQREDPKLEEKEIEEIPEECLSCPPFEELEAYTLGGIVESLREVVVTFEKEGNFEDLDATKIREVIREAMNEGIAQGRRQFASDLRGSFKSAKAVADLVEKPGGR